MTILSVVKSARDLERLKALLAALLPEAALLGFTGSPEALAAARQQEIDVAFLEADMPELTGLDLGRYLKEMYPQVNLVFLSDGPGHALEALALHASGYILKPAGEAALRRELDDLRHPIGRQAGKRVFAQTFGNFELFVDGEPVAFKYTRTKEIVALLVNNRGAQTTNGEIIGSLWEDDGDPDKKASYLSNLRQDLQNTMTRLKLNGIIIKQRGSMAIAADRIECDLYDWLSQRSQSKYRYMGDYMNQYSWAEYTHAELDELNWAMEDEA